MKQLITKNDKYWVVVFKGEEKFVWILLRKFVLLSTCELFSCDNRQWTLFLMQFQFLKCLLYLETLVSKYMYLETLVSKYMCI